IKGALRYRMKMKKNISRINNNRIATGETRSKLLDIFTILPQECWKKLAKLNRRDLQHASED
ncbi:39903_t:CDS:2, partial [Gigaspora margarita]